MDKSLKSVVLEQRKTRDIYRKPLFQNK